MPTTYRSDELFDEIIKNYSFIDKKKLKTATENELMALSHQTQDNIFMQYGIARKWDEAEKRKRRSNLLQRKFS